MKIFSELKRLAEALKPYDGSWALCGGVVASVYRTTPRFTADIDVAIVSTGDLDAEAMATAVLGTLGYDPIVGFVPGGSSDGGLLRGLVSGRRQDQAIFAGIDFLLPVFPWLPHAVARAQENRVDYGFERLATVTPEDLIVSKLFALMRSGRSSDLDDIESILADAGLPIDTDYVIVKCDELSIPLPETLRSPLVARRLK